MACPHDTGPTGMILEPVLLTIPRFILVFLSPFTSLKVIKIYQDPKFFLNQVISSKDTSMLFRVSSHHFTASNSFTTVSQQFSTLSQTFPKSFHLPRFVSSCAVSCLARPQLRPSRCSRPRLRPASARRPIDVAPPWHQAER